MRGCLQVLAGFVGLMFVATAVFALVLVNAVNVFTNREAVKEALGLAEILEETLPTLVNSAIAQQVAVTGLPLPNFDTSTVTQTVLDALPADWLDGATEAAVDGVFDYLLTGDEGTAVITLDLNPILAQLQGEPGRQVVRRYLESLPVCTQAEMLSLLGGAIPACTPPGISLDVLSQQVHGMVAPMLAAQITVGQGGMVQVPLSALFSGNPEMMQTMQRVRFLYQLAPQAWLLWLPPLFCLLFLLVLVVRSWRTWGLWWGWPLAAAGGVGLLLSLLIPGVALGWLRTAVFVPASASAIDALWQPLLQQGVINLSELWASRLAWQAGVFLLLGLAFLFFAFLAKKYEDTPVY